MLNKDKAREELKRLVEDFKKNPDYYKKLSEADVEDKLVYKLYGITEEEKKIIEESLK